MTRLMSDLCIARSIGYISFEKHLGTEPKLDEGVSWPRQTNAWSTRRRNPLTFLDTWESATSMFSRKGHVPKVAQRDQNELYLPTGGLVTVFKICFVDVLVWGPKLLGRVSWRSTCRTLHWGRVVGQGLEYVIGNKLHGVAVKNVSVA